MSYLTIRLPPLLIILGMIAHVTDSLGPTIPNQNRRVFVKGAAATLIAGGPVSQWAQPSEAISGTVARECIPGEPFDTCLGTVDGLFVLCDSPACVSSQDDISSSARSFAEPWEYDDLSMAEAFKELKAAVELRIGLAKGEDFNVVKVIETPDYCYLRAVYENPAKGTIDDAEWFLPANDVTVQFRAGRRGGKMTDPKANAQRMETIRKYLRYQKIPVVRNRRRVFIFGESPFDTFGPSLSAQDEFEGTAAAEAKEAKGRALMEWDPLAAPVEPPSAAMRALRNERPQLDDQLFDLVEKYSPLNTGATR